MNRTWNVIRMFNYRDGIRKLMSISDKDASDQKVKEKTNELRTKYPIFTAILERIPVMDLKETTIGLFGIDAMESLLKLRALVILSS